MFVILQYVCISEKSSIFIVFLHALLIFRLEIQFLVLSFKLRLAKWIIQRANLLPVIVEFIFCWESSVSVSTAKKENSVKTEISHGNLSTFAEIFLFALQKHKQNTEVFLFQSGHFRFKYLRLLTASFKDVSGIGLMHPSHIKSCGRCI